MREMKIYEPAMCCPTGLCGVEVDPELLRISTVLNTLKQNGYEVERFNLASAPNAFVQNSVVTSYLQKFGPDKLPVVTVDGLIVIAGRYPTNEEFAEWLECPKDILGISECCAESGTCCCGIAETNCCSESNEDSCCCGVSEETCCQETTEECCSSDCCCDGNALEGCCTSEETCCTENCCEEETAPQGCCCGNK